MQVGATGITASSPYRRLALLISTQPQQHSHRQVPDTQPQRAAVPPGDGTAEHEDRGGPVPVLTSRPSEDSPSTQLCSPGGTELDPGTLHCQLHTHILSKVHGGVVHLQLVDVDPAYKGWLGLKAAPRGWGKGTGVDVEMGMGRDMEMQTGMGMRREHVGSSY